MRVFFGTPVTMLEGTVGVPRCTVSGVFIFRFLVSEGSYLAVGGGKNGLGGRFEGFQYQILS